MTVTPLNSDTPPDEEFSEEVKQAIMRWGPAVYIDVYPSQWFLFRTDHRCPVGELIAACEAFDSGGVDP